MRIGIAGYMGAGKTTCARLLKERVDNAFVVDADAEAKKIIESDVLILKKLEYAFGDKIFCKDEYDVRDKIKYNVLGEEVFKSADTLRSYNKIVHPPIVKSVINTIKNNNSEFCILDAALLPLWSDAVNVLDKCIWVDVPFDVRLDRLKSKVINKNIKLDIDKIVNRMRLQEEIMSVPKDNNWIHIKSSDELDVLFFGDGALPRNAPML